MKTAHRLHTTLPLQAPITIAMDQQTHPTLLQIVAALLGRAGGKPLHRAPAPPAITMNSTHWPTKLLRLCRGGRGATMPTSTSSSPANSDPCKSCSATSPSESPPTNSIPTENRAKQETYILSLVAREIQINSNIDSTLYTMFDFNSR